MNTRDGALPASGPRWAFHIDEFAAISGIGRTAIFAAIRDGKLKARKAGRRTLIAVEDGRAFLDSLPSREAA